MSLQKVAASEKKYKLCVKTCIYSASVFLFCFAVHNTYAKNIFEDLSEIKISIYSQKTFAACGKLVAKYDENIKKIKTQMSKEKLLAAENVLAIERTNFFYATPDLDEKILAVLNERNDTCTQFVANKKLKQLDKAFLVSFADIKIRRLRFLQKKEALNESMYAKKLYEAALHQDKNFSPAHTSYSLWLFFAPPIAGGGYKAAFKEASKGIESAQNNAELFFALLYRSQIFFAQKKEKECKTDLDKAHALFPYENLTPLVREVNQSGKNFLD